LLKGVTVWTLDGSLNPVSRIDADHAESKNDRWTLKQAEVKDFSKDAGYRSSFLPSMEIAIKLKVDDLKVLDNNADNLSITPIT
jgi:lipopolysaccharide export system permease protein